MRKFLQSWAINTLAVLVAHGDVTSVMLAGLVGGVLMLTIAHRKSLKKGAAH